MPRLSLAKLERHLDTAAKRLRSLAGPLRRLLRQGLLAERLDEIRCAASVTGLDIRRESYGTCAPLLWRGFTAR